MDLEFFKTVGQIAGIGGLGLGVLLLVFRDIIAKSIFPTLKKEDAYRLLRLIAVLVFVIALASIGAWIWAEQRSGTANGGQTTTITGNKNQVDQKQDSGGVSQNATINGGDNKVNQKSGTE